MTLDDFRRTAAEELDAFVAQRRAENAERVGETLAGNESMSQAEWWNEVAAYHEFLERTDRKFGHPSIWRRSGDRLL